LLQLSLMNTPYAKYMRDELTDRLVYQKLAVREKNPENKEVLEHLAAQEQSHYEFWQSLAPGATATSNNVLIATILFLRFVLGVTFTVKFLELHEENMVEEYTALLPTLAEEYRPRLQSIINEETSQEKALMAELKEKRVAYVGFIALGLADAIVEITGVHAGFLGITGSTLIAGISGVTVGFAAAISMGSASYIQAKQDPEKSAVISALATGISYLLSVVLLALPYFITKEMLLAFTASTLVGVVLLAGFTFYGAVIFDRKFLREFIESVSLMLGTALATFFFGTFVGKLSGIGGKSF